MTEHTENHVDYDIIDRLLDRLDYIRIQPETIWVVGEHIDYIVKKLQQRYPSAIINSNNETVDLIIAHFALLQVNEPLALMHTFSQRLCDEGLLLLTSLGPDTFFELRDSFSKIDDHPHVDTFLDMHHVGDWMKQLHFSDPVVDREEIIIAYDDINTLFEDLKSRKSTNKNNARSRGLLSKNKWQKMLSHYATYKTEDYFPVTLEVIYGHAWKVKLPEQDESDREITISIDAIQRKLK